jgi:RNA polymerase sigma-70 factor (ECF subfamily)
MAVNTSDFELMSRVQDGDREAFNVLVQRYRKPLINFIYRFTASSGESEDLAHEVFLKIFQAAPRYEPRANFSTWLYRIATNTMLNYLRDHKSHLSIDRSAEEEGADCSFEIPDPHALIEDELIKQERVAQIRRAIKDLPENQRLALILTKYQNLSIRDVSEVLKCSESAVKSLIFRAYSTLREKLMPVVEVRA